MHGLDRTRDSGLLGGLIALYVLFLPIQVPLASDFRLAPSDLFLLLFLLVGLGRIRLHPWAWSPWLLGLVPLFAMGTLVTAVTWGSVRLQVLLQKDLGLLLLMSSYAVIADWASSWERMRRLIRLLVGTVALNNLAALIDFGLGALGLFHLDWLNYSTHRLAGLLVDPNAYGGLLALALVLHLTTSSAPLGERTYPSLSWAGLLDLLTTLSLTAGLLLTFSRSAWIGMAAACALALLGERRLLVRAVPAALLAGGLVLTVLGPDFLDVIVAMSSRSSQVTSRLDYIITALGHVSESPLWGVGLGFHAARYGWIIHNTAVWFLAEFGLIGLLLFAGFAIWFAAVAWDGASRADGSERSLLLGLLLGHAAMLGLSLGIEALYQRHWWVVLGLIAASRPLLAKRAAPMGVTA